MCVWFGEDVLERNGVVDLGVKAERVDAVVADEAFDSKAVVDVVALVERVSLGGREGEVGLEELAFLEF